MHVVSDMAILICSRDPWWAGPVAGLASTPGLFFENSHRISELMLYCMPKLLHILFVVCSTTVALVCGCPFSGMSSTPPSLVQLAARRGLAIRLPGGNVLIFALAMAALMLVDKQDHSSGHAALLRFLFGEGAADVQTLSARLASGVPLENLAEQAALAGIEADL